MHIEEYREVFQKYERMGKVKRVPKGEIENPYSNYMPHRAIIKEESTSSKIRPIFDGSSKGFNRGVFK